MRIFNTLFLLLLMLTSCAEKPMQNRFGIGDLKLGTEFKSLPLVKDFEEVLDNEYYIRLYKISDEIGYISDVYITNINGKISSVKFKSNKETKTDVLTDFSSNLIKQRLNTTQMKGFAPIKMEYFITPDTSAVFYIAYDFESRKKGEMHNEYYYASNEAVIKQAEDTKRFIGIK